jgi:hypothetical protein
LILCALDPICSDHPEWIKQTIPVQLCERKRNNSGGIMQRKRFIRSRSSITDFAALIECSVVICWRLCTDSWHETRVPIKSRGPEEPYQQHCIRIGDVTFFTVKIAFPSLRASSHSSLALVRSYPSMKRVILERFAA